MSIMKYASGGVIWTCSKVGPEDERVLQNIKISRRKVLKQELWWLI